MSGVASAVATNVISQVVIYSFLAILIIIMGYFAGRFLLVEIQKAGRWFSGQLGGSKGLGESCNLDTDCKKWGAGGDGKNVKCCKGKCTLPACMTNSNVVSGWPIVKVAACPADIGITGSPEGGKCNINLDCAGSLCLPGTGMPALACCNGKCVKGDIPKIPNWMGLPTTSTVSCPGHVAEKGCSADSDCKSGNCTTKTFCPFGFERRGHRGCCKFPNGKVNEKDCSVTLCSILGK